MARTKSKAHHLPTQQPTPAEGSASSQHVASSTQPPQDPTPSVVPPSSELSFDATAEAAPAAVDPAQLDKALTPRPAPPDALEPLSEADNLLRDAIARQLKGLDAEAGGLDLRDLDFQQVEDSDTSRFARMVYGLGYIRMLEALSLPPATASARMEQAKLALAYIRHAESNDREIMRLNERSTSATHYDKAVEELRHEVVRIASYRRRVIRDDKPQA